MSDPICKPDEIPAIPIQPIHPCWEVTPNYQLPLWRNNTATSWLVQLNTAMMIIDSVMHDFALRTSIDGEAPLELIKQVQDNTKDITEIKTVLCSTVESLKNITDQLVTISATQANHTQTINTLLINYTALDTRMTAAESSITNLRERVEKLETNSTNFEQRISALENQGGS